MQEGRPQRSYSVQFHLYKIARIGKSVEWLPGAEGRAEWRRANRYRQDFFGDDEDVLEFSSGVDCTSLWLSKNLWSIYFKMVNCVYVNCISVELLPKKGSLGSFNVHWWFTETVARSTVYNLAQENVFQGGVFYHWHLELLLHGGNK